MSASTPTARGGFSSLQLGGALTGVALAVVVVGGLIGLQATARRQAAPAPATLTNPTFMELPRPFDPSTMSGPTFIELPRPFDPSTMSGPTFIELPRPFDPSTDSAQAPAGGRGTRFAR